MASHGHLPEKQQTLTQQVTPADIDAAEGKSRFKWTDILKMLVFLGIGFFFIYWFLLKLSQEQKEAIWASFLDADYLWVVAAMLCSLLSHFVRALRWSLLFKPLGRKPAMNNIFGSVVVAYLANLAFPRAGEVMRCATLRTSDGIPMEKSLGTVVTERLIDTLAFGLVVLIGILAMFGRAKDWLYDTLSQHFESLPNMAVILSVLAVLAVAAFVLYRLFWKKLLHISLFKKINDMIIGMIDGVKSILHLGLRDTILFLVYSAIIYLLYILGGLIIFKAFGETHPLGMAAAFVVYLFGSVGMTFSQGGIGVYPALVQMALDIYGVSVEVGTACGWLLWGSQQVVVILVGAAYLVYFSMKKRRRKE